MLVGGNCVALEEFELLLYIEAENDVDIGVLVGGTEIVGAVGGGVWLFESVTLFSEAVDVLLFVCVAESLVLCNRVDATLLWQPGASTPQVEVYLERPRGANTEDISKRCTKDTVDVSTMS